MNKGAIDDFKLAIEKIREADRLLNKGPLSYTIEQLVACYDLLINKYAAFCLGDKVQLKITLTITEKTNHGWMGAKHFLVKGATGTIAEVGCNGKGFYYLVDFDDQTYISYGERKSVSQHGLYHFKEESLKYK